MIAAHARAVVGKGELPRVGVGDEQRLEQPLRVAMDFQDRLALLFGQQALERLLLALQLVDGLRLLVDARDVGRAPPSSPLRAASLRDWESSGSDARSRCRSRNQSTKQSHRLVDPQKGPLPPVAWLLRRSSRPVAPSLW